MELVSANYLIDKPLITVNLLTNDFTDYHKTVKASNVDDYRVEDDL